MVKLLYFSNEPNKTMNGLSQCFRCKAKKKFNVQWSCMMWTFEYNQHHYCSECKKFIEDRIRLIMKNNDRLKGIYVYEPSGED